MKIFLFFAIALTVGLCSCKSSKRNIETIINKYDTVDFRLLKNRCIHFRSRGDHWYTSAYFVNTVTNNCSPYVVEYNERTNTVVEISNHLVLKSCGKDYLSKDEIEIALKKYLEFGFCFIMVDTSGNVYINPSQQAAPVLLRKQQNATPKDIRLYKHYKGNWYVRR